MIMNLTPSEPSLSYRVSQKWFKDSIGSTGRLLDDSSLIAVADSTMLALS